MHVSKKSVLVALTCGIAACIALMPWGRWFGEQTDPDARLTERIAEYARLRQQEDWAAIYQMTDARDRKAVSLPRFLALYGRGFLKTNSLTEKARQIDVPNGTASVTMTLDAELQIAKLPAETRRSLGPQDPSALRKTSDFPIEWYWTAGTWWLRMDPEAVTGRSVEGKPINTVGG